MRTCVLSKFDSSQLFFNPKQIPLEQLAMRCSPGFTKLTLPVNVWCAVSSRSNSVAPILLCQAGDVLSFSAGRITHILTGGARARGSLLETNNPPTLVWKFGRDSLVPSGAARTNLNRRGSALQLKTVTLPWEDVSQITSALWWAITHS